MDILSQGTKDFKTGFIHFLLADVLFTFVFAFIFEIISFFIVGSTILNIISGVLGIFAAIGLTGTTVYISAQILEKKWNIDDPKAVALVATFFSGLITIISLPYENTLAGPLHAHFGLLFLRDIVHVLFFYIFSLLSLKSGTYSTTTASVLD